MVGLCAVKYYSQDFSCPHADNNFHRLIAFVLYLTDSKPGAGGDFVWCASQKMYVPRPIDNRYLPFTPSPHSFSRSFHRDHFNLFCSKHARSPKPSLSPNYHPNLDPDSGLNPSLSSSAELL